MLQGLQQIVELEDAANYHTASQSDSNSNEPQFSLLLSKWKSTNPNDNDPIYVWDDILTSRYFALRLTNERITGNYHHYYYYYYL